MAGLTDFLRILLSDPAPAVATKRFKSITLFKLETFSRIGRRKQRERIFFSNCLDMGPAPNLRPARSLASEDPLQVFERIIGNLSRGSDRLT